MVSVDKPYLCRRFVKRGAIGEIISGTSGVELASIPIGNFIFASCAEHTYIVAKFTMFGIDPCTREVGVEDFVGDGRTFDSFDLF